MKLGRRWALYVAGFLLFTSGVPAMDRLSASLPGGSAWLALMLVAAAAATRFGSLRQPPRLVDDVDAVTGGVLNLE